MTIWNSRIAMTMAIVWTSAIAGCDVNIENNSYSESTNSNEIDS